MSTQRLINGSETKKKYCMKNVKVSVFKWSSNTDNNHNTIINFFLAWKHGHVVAAVLSRAQLYIWLNNTSYIRARRRQLKWTWCWRGRDWRMTSPSSLLYTGTKLCTCHRSSLQSCARVIGPLFTAVHSLQVIGPLFTAVHSLQVIGPFFTAVHSLQVIGPLSFI